MSRILMFSSDCHAGLKTTDYVDYLESKYHDDLERFLVADAEWRETLRSQRPDAPSTRSFAVDVERRQTYATQLDSRLEALDSDGFAGEILFPDASSNNRMPFSAATMGGVSAEYPSEHHAAAMRAYNRWLSETVIPDRQIPLGQVPLIDPDYAIEQVKDMRAAGFRGIVPQWDGIDPSFPNLYDERLDPMWAICAADGLVVNFHTGSGIPTVLKRETRSESMIHAFEKVWWTRRALWHMILGGVLERHPTSRSGSSRRSPTGCRGCSGSWSGCGSSTEVTWCARFAPVSTSSGSASSVHTPCRWKSSACTRSSPPAHWRSRPTSPTPGARGVSL